MATICEPNTLLDQREKYAWPLYNAPGKNKLPTISAIMVLSSHIVSDIIPLGNCDCLLLPSANNFFPCTDLAENKGALVHFDSNKNEWIGCDLAVGEGGFVHTVPSHKIKAAKSNP